MHVDLSSIFRGTPVFLAPMAGITDLSFRSLALQFGADVSVSEMVASGEMLHGKPSALGKARTGGAGGLTFVQIAGREASEMAEAAKACAGLGAGVIDLNFGCPAKKVTNGLSGSALMRDPDHALRLIGAVVGAVDLPVTVKMRLGWDENSLNAPEIAARAEAAGVRMITVHGRTRCQFYKGTADWKAVRKVTGRVGIPVVVNGDVSGPEEARRAMFEAGAQGVMVGRAARGRPWLPGQISAALNGRQVPHPPAGRDLAELVLGHYQEMLIAYGRDVGRRVARKHLGWYLDGVGGMAHLRQRILRLADPDAVMAMLLSELSDSEPGSSGVAA